MKGFVLSFVFLSLTLSASAVPQEEFCYPRVSYNGFYFGGCIGYGQDYIEINDLEIDSTSVSVKDSKNNRVRWDIQLGYDWQFGNKVIGLVADVESLRTRGGIQCGNHLIFLTTGVAYEDLSYRVNDGSSFFGEDFNNIRWGWIGGVGTESPLWRNFTIGINLFYIYLPEKRLSGSLNSGSHYSFKSSASLWSAEVCINYRFGDFRCCR